MKVRMSEKHGRLMQYDGHSVRIFWSPAMLSLLRRMFPVTLNEELAGIFGVHPRTLIRKARELGLEKDREWLAAIWNERRNWGQIAHKKKGLKGAFKKGEHPNPSHEFKPGHVESEETKAKRVEAMRRHWREHPERRREFARKIRESWVRRRALAAEGGTP